MAEIANGQDKVRLEEKSRQIPKLIRDIFMGYLLVSGKQVSKDQRRNGSEKLGFLEKDGVSH